MSNRSHFNRVVILGGCGSVGRLFASSFAEFPDTIVTAVDIVTPAKPVPNVQVLTADPKHPTDALRRLLEECDLAILALPEDVAMSGLTAISGMLNPEALVVDTLSVKSQICEALEKLTQPAERLSINPMFAPSLGFEGQAVAVIPVRGGKCSDAFVEALRGWGSNVCTMSAEKHDRATAVMQTTTHAALIAFGLSLDDGTNQPADLLSFAPPPYRTMLGMVARLLAATPDVYWDIQLSNPYAAGARQRLAEALKELDESVSSGQIRDFERLIERLDAAAGNAREVLQEQCQRQFEALVAQDT